MGRTGLQGKIMSLFGSLFLGYIRGKRKILFFYNNLFKRKIVNIGGIKVQVDGISEAVKKYIYNDTYEYCEMILLRKYLKKDDFVMGVGTGIGFLSAYCAKFLGDSNVVTYEGNPKLENIILRTFNINNVSPELHMGVVGEHEGSSEFWISHDYWSSSIIKRDEKQCAIKVSSFSFNAEIKKYNPSFLILDIEGGESSFLKYANFHNIKKILIELHPNIIGIKEVKKVIAQIEAAGFVSQGGGDIRMFIRE